MMQSATQAKFSSSNLAKRYPDVLANDAVSRRKASKNKMFHLQFYSQRIERNTVCQVQASFKLSNRNLVKTSEKRKGPIGTTSFIT